jgi:glycosyltransferase involved in cell wall biosynthesis
MELVSDRLLTIDNQTFPAGLPFTVEDQRGNELIHAGTARHACPPDILYETQSPEQNAAALREQGITCLCLTRNRREWLPKAITGYLAQTVQPRELLILADGEDVRDIVPEREDIRLIHVEEGRTIGDKRNFGVSLARGKYIAHWDDDDVSAPDRLRDQLDRLRQSAVPVTGYFQIDFTDGHDWWRYTGDRDYAPGSSLFFEKEWALAHPFPAVQIGEDGDFVRAARERKMLTAVPANGMLTASIHSGNTSPRQLMGDMWQKLERSASGLTVIIPSRNIANVQPCVDAVRRLNGDARIVVIDDGIENANSLGVELLSGEKPFIFSRNMNAGIRFAGRDDVLLLNDDAILKTEGGFTALQKAAAERPEFGLIAATTNAVGNANQLPRGVGLREDPRQVCFVAVLIPRTALDKVGWLDERFTAYGFEDDDLCYRVRLAGLKIGIHDGCFVDHASLTSTFRGSALSPANLDGGRQIFIDKWGSYPL